MWRLVVPVEGICTSVVVGVSPELVHQGPGSPMLVGLGVGYRYGKGYVAWLLSDFLACHAFFVKGLRWTSLFD